MQGFNVLRCFTVLYFFMDSILLDLQISIHFTATTYYRMPLTLPRTLHKHPGKWRSIHHWKCKPCEHGALSPPPSYWGDLSHGCRFPALLAAGIMDFLWSSSLAMGDCSHTDTWRKKLDIAVLLKLFYRQSLELVSNFLIPRAMLMPDCLRKAIGVLKTLYFNFCSISITELFGPQ